MTSESKSPEAIAERNREGIEATQRLNESAEAHKHESLYASSVLYKNLPVKQCTGEITAVKCTMKLRVDTK
jgi:hypothetical protein